MTIPSESRASLATAISILSTGARRRIVVIGDLMLDRNIWGTSTRISPEAPVPVVKVQSETNRPGGSGNVVTNLVHLNQEVIPVGIIGSDSAGQQIIAHMDGIGVDAKFILEIDTAQTTQKTRIFAQNHQVARVDHEDLPELSDRVVSQLRDAVIDAVSNADAVIISDYSKGVCSPAICEAVIFAAEERNIPCLVDPKRADFSRYAGATIITPNFKELERATQVSSNLDELVAEAASSLRERFDLGAVLVTRGAAGMTLVEKQSVTHIGTEAHSVFDVSGAGDTVIATMCAGLLSGLSNVDSARLANVAAGIVIVKIGSASLSLDELYEKFAQKNQPVSADRIVERNQLSKMIGEWRSSGETIVFTNGCFDVLHAGHIQLFEFAAEQGTKVVVGVNSDQSITRLKGPGRPINNASSRMTVLAGIGAVDAVVAFDEDTPEKLIVEIQPDVLIKGSDYEHHEIVGADVVESRGGRVVRFPIVGEYSTTSLINRASVEPGPGAPP